MVMMDRIRSESPLVVVWRVMDRCNLGCPFCAYDSRLQRPLLETHPEQVEHMVAMLGAYRARTGRTVMLSWLGGEPTLWAGLPGFAALARQHGLTQSLTTNGSTLGSARMRALLVRNFHEITVSIDGFADFHDRMRNWPGAFSKLKKTVPLLHAEGKKAGLRLRANVVLMRGNIAAFPALCRELAEWGFDEITFNQLGGRDRPDFYPENRLRPDDIAALRNVLPDLRAELSARQVLLCGGDAYMRRIEETVHDIALPVIACNVAQEFLFIDEAGHIAPCAFVGGHFGIRVTDIRTPDDIASLGARLCTAQRNTPHAACANCMSTQQFAKFEDAVS
ncbi:MAG: radical SAM protein [Paracoccaceae bacterium]